MECQVQEWKVSIRRATLEDKDSVLGVRDVYDGLDYLPHYYDKFIQCTRCKCYVAEIQNKTVSNSIYAIGSLV